MVHKNTFFNALIFQKYIEVCKNKIQAVSQLEYHEMYEKPFLSIQSRAKNLKKTFSQFKNISES